MSWYTLSLLKDKLSSNSITCVTTQQYELISTELLSYFTSKVQINIVDANCFKSLQWYYPDWEWKFQYIMDVLLLESIIAMLCKRFGIDREKVKYTSPTYIIYTQTFVSHHEEKWGHYTTIIINTFSPIHRCTCICRNGLLLPFSSYEYIAAMQAAGISSYL